MTKKATAAKTFKGDKTPANNNGERQTLVTPILTSRSTASAVLFDIKERVENGPLMSGSVEVDSVKVSLSAFLEQAKASNVNYLNLSIGDKDQARYSGKLFRNKQKNSDNAPDYSGFITVLRVNQPEQYTADEWDSAPQLKIVAWRRRSTDGTGRIQMNIMPAEVADGDIAF